MNSKTKQAVYAIFALLGLVITWYYNLQYLSVDGNNILTFISDNKLNAASTSVWYDVLIAAFAAIFLMYHEAKRIGMKFWWVYAVLSCTVAIAFGLPLFLLMRERHLHQQEQL